MWRLPPGTAPSGRLLVIADDLTVFAGEEVLEPVFGLPSKWIPADQRASAEAMGATVVDRASVVTTHLAEIARQHAADLLSRQDVKALIELVREVDAAVVDDLTTGGISLPEVQRVLHRLLSEQVPIRDLTRILEVISERARVTRDSELIVEAARQALGGTICAAHAVDGHLPVITLHSMVEQTLLGALQRSEEGSYLAMDPDFAARLGLGMVRQVRASEQDGHTPALVCVPSLRSAMHHFSARLLPHVPVLSYDELPEHLTIDNLGAVSLDESSVV